MENESAKTETETEVKTETVKKELSKTAAKSRPAAKKKQVETLAPNIQFTGKKRVLNPKTGKRKTVARESPAFIIDGRDKIKLPKDLHLKAGAIVETDAVRVKSLFPEFKTPTAK